MTDRGEIGGDPGKGGEDGRGDPEGELSGRRAPAPGITGSHSKGEEPKEEDGKHRDAAFAEQGEHGRKTSYQAKTAGGRRRDGVGVFFRHGRRSRTSSSEEMGTAAATDDMPGPGEGGPSSPASPLPANSPIDADMQALRDGSPRAFAAFHRAHSPRLYAYLVRLTRDRALADDLFQESWLRLARALPGLLADDGRGNTPDLRAFVFAIARNAFLDARRADRRRPTIPLDDDTTDAGPRDDAPSLEAVLADRQTLGYLEEVLGTLPETAREILHLVAFEGMTPQEAAPVLGLTPEATRKRLERARGALAEALTARLRQTCAPLEF